MISGDCNVCINGKLPSYSATCVECGLSRKNYKPITNADRLRAMSDEELAEYFPSYATLCPDLKENEQVCKGANFMANDKMCRKCWLDWLKREVV